MPATKGKRKTPARKKTAANTKKPIRREVGAFVCLFLAIFSFIGFFENAIFLDFFRNTAKGLLGYGYYALPPLLLVAAFILAFHRGRPVRLRVTSALLLTLDVSVIFDLFLNKTEYGTGFELIKSLYADGQAFKSGGLFGGLLSTSLSALLSRVGTQILFIALGLLLIFIAFDLSAAGIFDWIFRRDRPEYEPAPDPEPIPRRKRAASPDNARNATAEAAAKRPAVIDIPLDGEPVPEPPPEEKKQGFFRKRSPDVKTPAELLAEEEARKTATARVPVVDAAPAPAPEAPPPAAPAAPPPPIETPVSKAETEAISREVKKELDEAARSESVGYQFPPLSLLEGGAVTNKIDATAELQTNATRLVETIASFGIEVRIINVTRGPTVTRYELELDRGVKLTRLTNLSDDIALALGAVGVRIAPIPDKISVVGIEVPNKLVSTVYIRDVIDSKEFSGGRSNVSFAIGKDIGGSPIIGDIAKLPHLLIAGTTGSGKSVCMNSLIVSLLYKASPEDVRLIMIDPKMIELNVYNGIPHLLIPVVTDPKKAAGALQWAVTEMMRRYKLFAEYNVREIFSYNEMASSNEDVEKLPQIVIVIDELADLMFVAAKEVEESVCRIAQMARAAGMHLVIATQRPSADVITGIMKANIPSRIAFAVASQLESRIILDTTGAEKLIGKGDMLYYPLGAGKPLRVQGCLISSKEVEEVVSFVKQTAVADYSDEVIEQIEKGTADSSSGGGGAGGDDAEHDELLPRAVDVILETGQASVSMLQRRLKLGYARAARLVDQLESRGIVGPFEGAKPRQILISKEEYEEMKMQNPDFYN